MEGVITNTDKKIDIIREIMEMYDFVKFTVADMHGIARTKVMIADKDCLSKGTTYFASLVGLPISLEHLVHGDVPVACSVISTLHDGNALMIPHLETIRPVHTDPSENYRIGEIYCEMMYYSSTGPVPQTACPRYMARHQLSRLQSLGYTMLSGYEAEMMILDADTKTPFANDYKYCITDMALVQNQKLLMGIAQMCKKRGVRLDAFHKEYDPGQVEYITKPLEGIESADGVFCLRETARQVAMTYKKQVTCMTAVRQGLASGFHFSHSLWSNGENKFYDEAEDNRLSALCMNWVAGIIKHMPALTAILCPTVNCYRRMSLPFCPSTTNWSYDDRFVSIRAKNKSSSGCLVENRLPSAAANPYLVMAANIAAGMDGITHNLQCPPSKDAGGKGETLSATLGGALDALERDDVLREALGGEFTSWFILLKRWEIARLGAEQKTGKTVDEQMDQERQLYMDLL